MKPQRRVARATGWVDSRLYRLRPLAVPDPNLSSADRLRRLAFVTIETHNTVATFLRAYYLSCATRAFLSNGAQVANAVVFSTSADALTDAIHREKPWLAHRVGPWSSRDEPTWHDANVVVRLLHAVGSSALPGVSGAFGLGTNAMSHLTTARNFFAHRGEETGIKLRRLGTQYGVSPPSDPSELLETRGLGRPQSVLEDWIDDLATVFSLMPS